MRSLTAAVVTVGSELTTGARVDTNTSEIARALAPRGFRVTEAVSIGDDEVLLAEELARLCSMRDLVVTTGGLGPTHDDITRRAAARALGVELRVDERLLELLGPIRQRHSDPQAAEQVLAQAEVLPRSEVIDFTTGTAPGLMVPTAAGTLCLLPGPPSEMRPMLRVLVERFPMTLAEPHELGVVGIGESDAQVMVQRAIEGLDGIGFTILARPGDIRVILSDEGAGGDALADAAARAAGSLGDRCYSTQGRSLAETVVGAYRTRRATVALAESCTGGMVSSALTDVPGSSEMFAGAVVSYSNESKTDLLGVAPGLLAQFGAVSSEVVEAMADGALRAFPTADFAVAVSGIAGPDGGSEDKPLGTVWFALAQHDSPTTTFVKTHPKASREAVRARATATGLDSLRRAILGLPFPG